MKKKFLAALLAVSMVASLCACGNQTEPTDDSQATETTTNANKKSTRDYNAEEYVTVGALENLTANTDVYTFTDADVEKEVMAQINYYIEYMDLYNYSPSDKQTVETGDVVNMNYKGVKDGEAFQGGTAEGAHLKIGSGKFIPGFEDGLIGHNVGDSFDLPLTFPEEYQMPDLAGQDVVFTVSINSIDTPSDPEITPELIQGMGMNYNSLEEYLADVKSYMQKSCDDRNKSAKASAAWDVVYPLCEVKDAPQEMVDDALATLKENIQSYADYYGVSMDEFIEQNMEMTKEDFEKDALETAQDAAKEKLAIAAIAKKAGIEVTDADVQATAEAEYASNNYESAEAMLAAIGEGSYYDYLLSEKVNDYLIGIVSFTENAPISMFEETQQ